MAETEPQTKPATYRLNQLKSHVRLILCRQAVKKNYILESSPQRCSQKTPSGPLTPVSSFFHIKLYICFPCDGNRTLHAGRQKLYLRHIWPRSSVMLGFNNLAVLFLLSHHENPRYKKQLEDILIKKFRILDNRNLLTCADSSNNKRKIYVYIYIIIK